jgi:tetratricopeptide (TPR) repeat protein
MAQYNRPPKQKAQKPDEFISFFDRLVRYFYVHQQKFIVLVAAAVLGLGIYGLYRIKVSRDIQKFSIDYMEAEKAPSDKSLELWKKFAEMKPPAQLPELIVLQIGGNYVSAKDWSEAAKAFQSNGNSSSKILRMLSQLAYAGSLENAKQYSQAFEAYQKISQDMGNPFQEEGRLGQARCLSGMGKDSDAETILIQLIAKGSEAPQSVKAAALNKLIAMKLPAAPESAPSKNK